MDVDTSDYPYPFHKFQGTWSVNYIDSESSVITLSYDYLPKYGIIGKIMMNRMFIKIAKDMINDIIDQYLIEVEQLKITN
ncbi:MAG: hypothetical protein HeimC2_12160 [Candidatus Heimdallarchaeota archaeon LC_2]|nr:MAG: hypothetical protein HeimC2_12160 [Candidatus Heimdallarchaeota archaeon LC_2]